MMIHLNTMKILFKNITGMIFEEVVNYDDREKMKLK